MQQKHQVEIKSIKLITHDPEGAKEVEKCYKIESCYEWRDLGNSFEFATAKFKHKLLFVIHPEELFFRPNLATVRDCGVFFL